jgi:hypothetical protein
MPTLGGEADDTNEAINAVPVRYSQAVKLFWQYEGKSISELARRCGKGVYRTTFEQRVVDGHVLVRAEIAKRSEVAREMRDRLESMQTA